jgi:hypothetical protein
LEAVRFVFYREKDRRLSIWLLFPGICSHGIVLTSKLLLQKQEYERVKKSNGNATEFS